MQPGHEEPRNLRVMDGSLEDQTANRIGDLLYKFLKCTPQEFVDILYLASCLKLSVSEIAFSFDRTESIVEHRLKCIQRVLLNDLLREGIALDMDDFLHNQQLQQALEVVMDEDYERIIQAGHEFYSNLHR